MIKFCFACFFIAIIITSLIKTIKREPFIPKNMGKKVKQQYNKHRRNIKKKLNNQYENLTNKFTSAKIKYL